MTSFYSENNSRSGPCDKFTTRSACIAHRKCKETQELHLRLYGLLNSIIRKRLKKYSLKPIPSKKKKKSTASVCKGASKQTTRLLEHLLCTAPHLQKTKHSMSALTPLAYCQHGGGGLLIWELQSMSQP